jgi:tetratricopeptide (TPR) repeat protein
MDGDAIALLLFLAGGPAVAVGWQALRGRAILVPWRVGHAHLEAGRFVEAEAKFRETLALAERRFGVGHWRTSLHLNALGQALLGQRRLDDAKPIVERALAIAEPYEPLPNDHVAIVFLGASIYFRLRGDTERAQGLLDRARREGRHSSVVRAAIERTVALQATHLGDEARAADAYGRVPADLLKERDARQLVQLGLRLLRGGDARRAVECLRRAVFVAERASCGEFVEAFYRGLLGEALSRDGRHDDALGVLEQAAMDYEAVAGRSHPSIAPVLVSLAELRARAGDEDGARRACQRVLGIALPAVEPADPYRVNASGPDPLEPERERARSLLARLRQST